MASGIGNSLTDLFTKFNVEAMSVYAHVTAQRQIANISIERSVELYMEATSIQDPDALRRLLGSYERVSALARTLGIHNDKCTTCPDV